jgi:hypothetical protein
VGRIRLEGSHHRTDIAAAALRDEVRVPDAPAVEHWRRGR